jgi:hydrophobe/amphiphile efflux-3 (HAE3) family protein
MLKKVASFIVRHRTTIIILTIVLTVLFGYFVRKVKMSSDLISLAPEDNQELIALKKTLEKFGSSTFIMISVKAEDAYSLSTLTKIKKISEKIRKLPEVADVLDPLNATIFKYLFGAVVIKKSLPGGEIPQSQEKIENFKKEMLSEPILKNVVVSENGESLAIYIRLKDDHNSEFLRDKLLKIVEPYQGPEKFYMSGRPIIESWVKEYLKKDSIKLAVPILILVIIVLFINFRSARGIFLPISIMLGSIIWTLGLMGIFDKTITMVGVMLPTLILVISSSYSIHFLNQYFKDIYYDSHKKRNIEKSIINIGKTIFLAALTTIAGFAALTINKIKPMRELGIFVLIGVFFSMILSLTFLPGLLTVLKKPKGMIQASREGSRTNTFFDHLGEFITKRWIIILVIALAISVWSCLGIAKISVDTSWERWFKKSSEILATQKFIKSNYGGISTFNVTFEIDEQSDLYFKSLDTLGYIDQVEQWIKETGAMGKSTSLIGYIKRANQLMNKNDPEMYKLPETEADLLKILLMFKMSEFTKSLNNVITEDFRNANILVRISKHHEDDPSIPEYKGFISDFNVYTETNKFDGIKVQMTGVDRIYVSLVDYLVRSQLLSIAISVVIVFIIITVTFRSLVYGLFGLIPIIFGLLLNFGAMSYFHIPLDFITSMIASIAVGLGVDNSIHFLIRFSKTGHALDLKERLKSALVASGIPIFFTSFTLIAGFSVLLFSSFKPILYFGLLISVTMFGCLIGVIFVLPALVYCVKPRAIIEGKKM